MKKIIVVVVFLLFCATPLLFWAMSMYLPMSTYPILESGQSTDSYTLEGRLNSIVGFIGTINGLVMGWVLLFMRMRGKDVS